MEIKSELADIKNRIRRNDDPDIEEHIECDDVVINIYTERDYLIVDIPVNGDPSENKYMKLSKQVMFVFGGTMLPNPDTSSLRVSYKIKEFQ